MSPLQRTKIFIFVPLSVVFDFQAILEFQQCAFGSKCMNEEPKVQLRILKFIYFMITITFISKRK